MQTVIIDIETNGIEDWNHLSDLQVIHCLVVRAGRDVKVYNSQRGDVEEHVADVEGGVDAAVILKAAVDRRVAEVV